MQLWDDELIYYKDGTRKKLLGFVSLDGAIIQKKGLHIIIRGANKTLVVDTREPYIQKMWMKHLRPWALWDNDSESQATASTRSMEKSSERGATMSTSHRSSHQFPTHVTEIDSPSASEIGTVSQLCRNILVIGCTKCSYGEQAIDPVSFRDNVLRKLKEFHLDHIVRWTERAFRF